MKSNKNTISLPNFHSFFSYVMALIVLLFSRTAHAQFVDIGPKGGPNYTTQPGSGSGTGQIHCFAIPAGYTLNFCPNSFKVIYAGAPTSGLWKSIDGGQSWNVIDAVQHLPINSVNDIALSEECPNYTIYISTGNTNTGGAALYSCGIYKSTDFGQSFQPISTFNDVFHFNISDRKLTTKIAVSPFNTNLIFVATSDGLYRSTNGGVNWQLVCTESATGDDPGMPGIWSVECSRNDPNTIYCSGKDVYRSTDGGATFSVLTNYLISNTNLVYRNSNIKVANNGGVDKLVVNIASKYTSGTLNQLFTFNSGIWSLITGSTSGFYASSANIPTSDRIKLDVMRTNSNVIIAGATETHITTNSGNSWGVATPYGWYEVSHGDIHAIQFFPTGDSALIGTDGGIYKYFVNSNTYKEQNYGLSISYINDMSVSPNRKSTLVIGKNDTNTDWFDGSKWNQLGLFGDGYPPVLWDMYMDSIFYTDNPGCSAPCKGLYKVDTKLGTTTDISSQTGCYGYGGNMFQNPNPYRKDEMYKIEGKSVTLSNQINHATQFTKMDETHENDAWTASYRRLFVSKGDPNVIYVWNYVFEPPYNSTLAVKIHRENYTVGTSGLCSPAALCTGICDSTLHPLPLSDYSGTVVSTSYLPEVYNATSIANYFPVSAIVTSNTNPNKIWASFEMNLKRITDITTPMPSHKLFQLRKSTNRGIDNSWTDDDAGLPAMTPISHLLYIDGSDDALVCATHTGRVFFKKDGSTAWAELDPNLPHSPIAKIEFNYCQRKLYVGFIGRGVWVYDFSTGSPNLSALKINGSVNWSNKTLDIGADIDIMPGGILEISTSKVNMGKGTKITIEKGTSTLPSGRLLVDNNTVITNTCGELWKGIEVIGDPNQPQVLKSDLPLSSTPFLNPTKQGLCIIINSTIENMEKGILLGKFDYTDAFYGNAYSGGQVYTYNSAFNDNLVSISAMSYTNPNPLPTIFGYSQSRVNQCSFTNKTRTNFGMHIFLYDVKGFQVMGCSFNNLLSTSNSYNSTQRGAGVVGWNAIAEILNYRDQISNVYVKNRFSNLTYGVYFSNNAVVGDATRNLKITQCSFKGNTYGIYLNGVKYPAVVNDSIDVPILPGTLSGTPPLTYYSSTKSYGIYLNGCSDYKVQNDTVKSAAVTIGSISTGVSYGIVVNNGSSLPTMIRRNQIVQTNYGLTAVGNNGSSASGLLFQCNTLKNNTKYDIWLAENTVNGTTTTGTIRDQGALSSTPNATTFASDNQFYQLSSSYPQYQLMRNAQTNSYTYFYYQFDLTKIPARISNTNPILLNQFGVTSNCSDNVIPDDYTPVSALKIPIEVTSIRKTLKQDEEYYLAKLEEGGGSFQEIVDSITARPYVSMDVLHKVLVHPIANTCLPSVLAMVQQHSGSDDSIAYYLAKAHLPFSKSVLTELQKHLQVKSSSQYSAVMRANVLEAQLEAMIINQAIKYVDSGDVEHALRFLEASCYSPNLHYFWAEMAMQYGSLQLQQRVIDTLLHYPSEHLNHRLGEYYTLLNSSQVRKNSRKSVDTAPLYVLYKNGDAVSSKAAALLGQLTDTLLAPYLPDPDLDLERDANVKDYWLEIPTTNSIYLLVTPNPADNAVSVFYQIPNAKEVILEVLDMQGKLIFSRTTNEAEGKININSSQWESGSYFIKVLDANSNEFKSDKLTIIH